MGVGQGSSFHPQEVSGIGHQGAGVTCVCVGVAHPLVGARGWALSFVDLSGVGLRSVFVPQRLTLSLATSSISTMGRDSLSPHRKLLLF